MIYWASHEIMNLFSGTTEINKFQPAFCAALQQFQLMGCPQNVRYEICTERRSTAAALGVAERRARVLLLGSARTIGWPQEPAPVDKRFICRGGRGGKTARKQEANIQQPSSDFSFDVNFG